MKYEISPKRTRPDPNNPGWTIPRTWGVWDIGAKSGGKRYRFGNNPVRGDELKRECGRAQLVALYTRRDAAKSHADRLNA